VFFLVVAVDRQQAAALLCPDCVDALHGARVVAGSPRAQVAVGMSLLRAAG
jgi:hypothetical protein